MIPSDQIKAQAALECLSKVLDAIPKGKRTTMMYEMCMVECAMKEAFVLLDRCRRYFLDTTPGEQSPFVQKIDELLPRAKE
jgi:hypothetical protein